ncbi:MAG: RDD family protein [Aridibacter sp.]
MICPGCNKENFNEISVCVACGTMIHDSVREELALKIISVKKIKTPIIKPIHKNTTPKINNIREKIMVKEKAIQTKISPPSNNMPAKLEEISTGTTQTKEISIKHTSPTLLEFQNKNAPLPDWRLQLQNAVKQRYSENKQPTETAAATETISAVPNYSTQGNAALKVQTDEINIPEDVDNEHLRNALARIESSRRKFLKAEPETAPKTKFSDSRQNKNFYKLRVANKDDKPAPISEELKSSVNFPDKPKFVPKIIGTKTNLYDTSELDPNFPPAKISSSFDKRPTVDSDKEEINSVEITERQAEKIPADNPAENQINKLVEGEEIEEVIDDYAPFSLRFNAGLFDLIIGSFISLLLLAPFMLWGGNWFTATGFLAFLAIGAIVLFVYQTISVGVFGKTIGMHLFSLEMIDFDGELYPTFHQAAVSSAIYLLSLAFFGMGFLTTFFDEDKRSVHDIVSGTLVVKEI